MPPDTGSAKRGKAKEETEAATLSGTYMFPNGDKYEGEYKKSSDNALIRNGTGTHTTSEGMCYHGNWDNDKMNGSGHLHFPSGAIYQGEFVDNRFHGKGMYSWPNGAFYTGIFKENRMEGEGEFKDTEGQTWTGQFRYKAAPGLRFKLGL